MVPNYGLLRHTWLELKTTPGTWDNKGPRFEEVLSSLLLCHVKLIAIRKHRKRKNSQIALMFHDNSFVFGSAGLYSCVVRLACRSTTVSEYLIHDGDCFTGRVFVKLIIRGKNLNAVVFVSLCVCLLAMLCLCDIASSAKLPLGL